MKLSKQFFITVMLTAFAMPLHSQGSMIREDRVWVYQSRYNWEWQGKYEFKMRFDGVKEADGHTYHRLIAYDARLSWCRYPDPTPIVEERQLNATYLLREEDGRVYLHRNAEDYWGGFEGTEALLYDFNVEEEEEIDIITDNGIASAKVTSVAEVMVDGKNCKLYDTILSFYGEELPYPPAFTVVEGLGNLTWGTLPTFKTVMLTGGDFSEEKLLMVTDLEGNVIYEGCEGWPGEFNSVAQVIASPGLTYNGNCVSADGAHVTLYDMAGQKVASGHGEVPTAGLQPGVYFAAAGGKTLRILVR